MLPRSQIATLTETAKSNLFTGKQASEPCKVVKVGAACDSGCLPAQQTETPNPLPTPLYPPGDTGFDAGATAVI
jgi:hypothetical protein